MRTRIMYLLLSKLRSAFATSKLAASSAPDEGAPIPVSGEESQS